MFCHNGGKGRRVQRGGTVRHVLVDAVAGKVTDLVVGTGLLGRREVVVPAAAVMAADERGVRLALSPEQLRRQPRYRAEDYAAAYARWRPTCGTRPSRASPGLEWRRLPVDLRADCLDGYVGTIRGVLVHPETWDITHLVLRVPLPT